MGKASDMRRAWVSGLKLKQWLRWVGGDSPLPEVRSRMIMGATAGVGIVLVALASFTLGVGGGTPGTGVKTNTPGVQYSPPVAPLTAPQSGFVPAASTTVATSTTTIGTATGSSKRSHSHVRRTGARRTRNRGLG